MKKVIYLQKTILFYHYSVYFKSYFYHFVNSYIFQLKTFYLFKIKLINTFLSIQIIIQFIPLIHFIHH